MSLGCAKNLVDSERLLASAVKGLKLAPCPEPGQADLIVVNTCAFLQSAVEEALGAIMELGAGKKAGAKMMVLGCLPARYPGSASEGRDLRRGLAEVDLWLGPDRYADFESEVLKLLKLKAEPAGSSFGPDGLPVGERLPATPFFRAFLKIAEGCDNRCSYCLIPRLRGPLRSYPAEGLAAEAEELAAAGVRELTLVAQDLTAYGLDCREALALPRLLKHLAEIPGLDWLRLLYAYPERLSEELVKELAAIPKLTPYLDLPFQHVSLDILKRMGRLKPVPPLKLVKNLRRWWPGVALRTTLIVGFPGESEKHFQELLDFVEEAAFEHLGVFKFSPELEAPASRFPDQVPQHLKEKRRRKIMSLQRKISLAHNRSRIGQTVPVLVEGPSPESELVMAGRGTFQAPEVDGLIFFDGEQPQVGQIVETLITGASHYDLLGRLL